MRVWHLVRCRGVLLGLAVGLLGSAAGCGDGGGSSGSADSEERGGNQAEEARVDERDYAEEARVRSASQ